MSYKRLYLYPAALIYGFIIRARNAFFNWGLFKQINHKNVFVIGVGNLTTGGTGKTPMVEYLIRKLSNNYKVVVLSRGYGRKSRGFRLVTPSDTIQNSGDEPLQIATKFENIKVVVQEDRNAGIKNIMKKIPDTEIILLDDSFQHRKVKPDINILLTDYFDLYANDFLLPVGGLREHKHEAKRADVVIVTKCDKFISPITKRYFKETLNLLEHQRLLTSYIVYEDLKHYEKSIPFNFDKKKYTTAICFSGIANNYWFINEMKNIFSDIEIFEFGDHHNYSVKEIKKIVQKFKDNYGNRKVVVTTEKDLMRLKNKKFESILKEIPLFYLPIKTEFHDSQGDELIKIIKEKLLVKVQNS
ncbi:tetraacyldisaccharide 4'-kinase [Bacteroidales bacterium OttesenSCG-928-K03]|nr:tetraacyldisaccharide 4'-kinase [Odoribacter sp. OttesenSCG-928-L07]MDL2239369.1 tetraacyldisaccharide 4'-kinase [Bacteroidales bacterium OttesenSCG-928-L14]MDL2240584.1 tetraacyldisaccharide 4'-kinase [Bacteroidales bacterium OttesenSCG-928-K22]MDL2242355.1 tetraacyldisaccharide 4'-kinase [Bacteroidales bacterium OttesenSCG-928-K03]